MRTFMIIIACLLLMVAPASGRVPGQDDQPTWTGGVSFPNGINVKTGYGTIPPTADLKVTKRSVETGQMTAAQDNSFRRVLKLADGRAVIYEVLITPLEENARFEVKLRSVVPTAAQAKRWEVDPTRVETNFLRNYSAPLSVGNGDILAIDVLINPQTGVKLVDYYRISNKPLVEEANPTTFSSKARQFKAEDVELSVFKYELRVNGETVHKSGGGMRGRFIWVDIPKVGRFLFSLAQAEAEAAGFLPSAFLSEHQIVFTHGGNRYELIAEQQISPGTGVYYLWMLFDPTFSIPSQPNLPPEFGGEPKGYGRMGAADYLDTIKKRN